jgi:hypothetical protein
MGLQVPLGLDAQVPEKSYLWRYLGDVLRELTLQKEASFGEASERGSYSHVGLHPPEI